MDNSVQLYARRMAISPDYYNDGTVFAVTCISPLCLVPAGIFKTSDGGVTWSPSNNGLLSLKINHITVSPDYKNDKTVLVAVGGDGVYNGIYKSTDGCSSWSPSSQGLSGGSVQKIEFSPFFIADRTVFAGTKDSGIYKSTDGGSNWAAVNNGLLYTDISDISVSPAYNIDRTVFVAAANGGIYKSTDGGGMWLSVNQGLLPNIIGQVVISPDYNNDKTIFAGSYKGIFRSRDEGASWVKVQNFNQYDDTSPRIVYVGSWKTYYFKDTVARGIKYSNIPGDELSFPFIGGSLKWIGTRGPQHGMAYIYIDDQLSGTVDLYAPGTEVSVPVFQVSGVSQGIHILRIVISSNRNQSSSSNIVTVDAFDVYQ